MATSSTREMFEGSMNNQPEFYISPPLEIPGLLATFMRPTRLELVNRIENEATERRFVVRAVVMDQVPLSFDVVEFIKRDSNSLLIVNGNPLTIYLHHTGNH